jgi:hypothetical protein
MSTERKIYVLSDQLIRQLADLLCLSMATNTHIGDHFRTIRLEESTAPGMESKLVLTPEYVEVYNTQVKQLHEEVDTLTQKLDGTQPV